jgi:hypothetical protein
MDKPFFPIAIVSRKSTDSSFLFIFRTTDNVELLFEYKSSVQLFLKDYGKLGFLWKPSSAIIYNDFWSMIMNNDIGLPLKEYVDHA